MKPRTFRAPHMKAALEQVQQELGPDALVLSVREALDDAAWKVWRRPGVEVVAMNSVPPPAGSVVKKPAPKVSTDAPVNSSPARRELESLLAELVKRPSKKIPPAIPAALKDAKKRLLSQGVDKTLAGKLVDACKETLSPEAFRQPEKIRQALAGHLAAEIQTGAHKKLLASKVVVVVGASGAGKTSFAAKLVAHAKRELGRKVSWISADTLRAGAIAEARVLTEGLAIPLHLAYTPEELHAEVESEKNADFILVDTSACNPRRDSEMVGLTGFLSAIPGCAVYPVLSATTKESDLKRILAAFAMFKPKGLVITRLDETDTLGNIVNATWQCRIPLAAFTRGPRILDGFSPADVDQLFEFIYRTLPVDHQP